jgi:translation initiation factor 2 subunit 1
MVNMPELDEMVLATVKKIMPYGAFCTLDEYGNQEAFLHVSEVAPRWIKNIHEFLHEGQHLVGKVHHLDASKNQVDISLKRLTESERKRKLEAVRHGRRAEKLFEVALKQAKSIPAEAMTARKLLVEKYGDLLVALEEISNNGEAAIAGLKIEKGLAKALLTVAQKSIRKAKASMRAVIEISSYSAEGVKDVQTALSTLKVPEGKELDIHYLGAPKYQITLTGTEFKDTAKSLDLLREELEEHAKKHDLLVKWQEAEAASS